MSFGNTIIKYFKSHKFSLFIIFSLIILVTLISLLPAQILRVIVDDVIGKGNKNKLFISSIIFAISYFMIGIITFIKDYVMLSTSQSIMYNLRLNMMKHVHKLSYKSLVKNDSGTLETYFNNDVDSINELFTSGVVNIATDFLKIIGIVATIFLYSIKFGLIILIILPFLILFVNFVRRKMLKAQLKTKSLEGNINKILLENIENIEELKANKSEAYATKKYDVILNNHFKASQNSNFYDAIFSPIMQMLRSIVICIILLICGINSDIFGLSIGMVVSGISLITDLFSPIENLGMEIQTIQKSQAAVKRINSFFKLETDLEKEDNSNIKGESIILKDVSFSYDDKLVIENFNLNISKNDKIIFQGPSGVGKSTLMKLIMGIIKPTSGSVTIDGKELFLINDFNRRKLFSIVYQDTFFSGGSIYEEISLCDSAISKDDVYRALRLVGLDYIKDIDIPLNDKEYSSGELALFNIARVVCRDTPIIFLDEMNSKIDPITSEELIKLIDDLCKDKIVISINHYGNILNNAKVIKLKALT
ncbi:MAG: ABC transporter ATP-binding protein [Anaeroplasma sp.]